MSEEKNNEKETRENVSMTEKVVEKKESVDTANKTIKKGLSKVENVRARRPRRPRRMARRGTGERIRPEFEQKVIAIRRVTRVVAGGRRFSFSVALIAGDRKGRVGVGVGKSPDTASAIEKAARDAKKNMIKVRLNKEMSVPHEVSAKFASTHVVIKPSPGKGLVAGSSVRSVLDLAGITDVSSKILSRSKNRLNNARAAVKALKELDK